MTGAFTVQTVRADSWQRLDFQGTVVIFFDFQGTVFICFHWVITFIFNSILELLFSTIQLSD